MTATRTTRPGATALSAEGTPPAPRLRSTWWVVLIAAVVLLTAVVALGVGPAAIAPWQILGSVQHHVAEALGMRAPSNPLTAIEDAIVWQGRAPRVATALLVGAGLAIAGSVMQSLLRNPLADPYLLGLSSGASLGAVAVLVLGIGLVLPVAAFAGAMLAMVATLTLAGSASRGRLTPGRTILAGVAIGQGCGAVTSFVVFTSAQGEAYREVLGWLLGTLAATTWSSAAIAAGALAVTGTVLILSARSLDAFAFGDTAAWALGVNVVRTRWMLLTVVALLVGALVSVSGSIGFVGLVVPHAVRLLVGSRQARVAPLAAITGGFVLLVADTVARVVIAPSEIPVGVITAAVGAPVFAVLLARRGGEPG